MAVISPNVSSGPYTANGSQTAFPFAFSILTAADIAVEIDGAAISPSLYGVTFGDTSGTVTFLSPPASGAQILIVSSPDYLQTSEFSNQGAYSLSTVNTINRRGAIKALVTEDKAERALKAPRGESGLMIPSFADRSDKLMGFDVAGRPIGVAAAASDLSAIVAIGAQIISLADNLGPIGIVATDLAGVNTIGTVVANLANVNAVGLHVASVISAAANMTAIIGAPAEAVAAQDAANLALAMTPAKDNTHVSLRQHKGSFAAGAPGGGYTAGPGVQTYATYYINVEDALMRTAGRHPTIKIPVLAGALTAANITQKNGATTISGPTAMTIESGYAIARNVTIDPATTNLFFTQITAGGAGVTVDDVGFAYGEPASVVVENGLSTRLGAIADATDEIPFVRPALYSYEVLAGATPTFNSVDGLVCPLTTQAYFSMWLPIDFEPDALYTLYFKSANLPSPTQVLAVVYNGINALSTGNWGTTPVPFLRKVGEFYAVSFYANRNPANPTYPFRGLALRIDNVSPLTDTVTASDFRIVKGNVIPTRAKTSAAVIADTTKVTRNRFIAGPFAAADADTTKIAVWGSSIGAGNEGGAGGGPASNWPNQLQLLLTAAGKICTVTNNSVRGATSMGMIARANSTPAIVTVVGGSIPAAATAVDLTFSDLVDFFSSFTVAEGDEPLNAMIAGRYGTISRVGAIYKFTPVAAASATPVPLPVPITTDIGVAARRSINVLEVGRNDSFPPWTIPQPGLPDYMMGFVDRHIDYMLPVLKRIVVNPLIIGLLDRDSHNVSDIAQRRIVDTRYKVMLAAVGIPILDFNCSMTPAELAYMQTTFGYTLTTQDQADDALGLLPTSMRQVDGLHQNLMGNRLLGYRAYNLFVTELGWVH